MSSELLASGVDNLKGHLAGAFNVLTGSSGDYTDLGIGRKFGGAAAAYSLRDVGAMNGPVVRVRRDSDNSEQDFSALAVPFIPDWCNRQVIKPLDVKALQSDGRTGDFIIAKAAYSLRSLGDRQATVAATNDTVARADGKYVVQVRRSSDDTIKSFTADEVTDGTLVNFVNEDVTIYQSDFSAGVNGFTQTSTTTLTGNQDGVSDEAGTTKDNVLKAVKASDAQGYIQRDQGVVAGLTYTVSGTFFAPTSNTSVDGIMIKDGLSGSALSNFPSGYLTSSGVWTDFSFSYTATASGNQRINFGISSLASNPTSSSTGSTGDIFYISDLKFVETTSNGFVRTWYDQSVTDEGGGTATGNHAVQATAAEQPKVVENGSLILQNGEATIKFDGTDDSFDAVSISSSSFPVSVISLSSPAVTNSIIGLYGIAGQSGGFYHSSAKFSMFAGSRLDSSVTPVADNDFIRTDIFNGSSSSLSVNGTETTGTIGTDTTALTKFEVGNSTQSGNNVFNGSIKEIILYTTDQTDNRGAFEANIAEHYGISGVPAEDNQVNGFVETWYDQSGNGRDVTQTTADKQPKIVSSGALVTSNSLPSIDFTSSATRLTATDFLTGQLNSYFTVVQIEAGDTADAQVTWRQGANYRLTNEFRDNGNILANIRDAGTDSKSATATGDLANGTVRIVTTLITARGADGITIFVDGGNSASNDTTIIEDTDFSVADDSSGKFGIGGIYNTDNFDSHGKGSEFIFFNTDQSANRTNIESNIANHYGITLS